MIPQELALRFALLKVLVTELSTAKKAADCEIRDGWRPSDRLTATLPGRRDIGTVTLANGKTTAKLTDERAFEDWVKANRPEQMTTVTMTLVDPGYLDRLLAAARKLGEAYDAETGEVVPGITVQRGEPYPMVKLTEDAREAVAEAWRDGTLAELVTGLLAIEGGES